MARSGNSKGKKKAEIKVDEFRHIEQLIKGHKKLLQAIGNL